MKIYVDSKQPVNLNSVHGFLEDMAKRYAPMEPIVKSMELDVLFYDSSNNSIVDALDDNGAPAVAHVSLMQAAPDDNLCKSGSIASLEIKVSTTEPVEINSFMTMFSEYFKKYDWLAWAEVVLGDDINPMLELEPYDTKNLNRHHITVNDVHSTEPGYFMPFTLNMCFKSDVTFNDVCHSIEQCGKENNCFQAIKILTVRKV